jgi:hypothetical protein
MTARLTEEFANRTSRRGFIGRSAKFLVAIVGTSTAAGIFAGEAFADCTCEKTVECEYVSCPCVGSRFALTHRCNDCFGCLHHYTCTTMTCVGGSPQLRYPVMQAPKGLVVQ